MELTFQNEETATKQTGGERGLWRKIKQGEDDKECMEQESRGGI